MRTMEFTTESLGILKLGQELEVTESALPTSYYYTMEHALGMSGNFSNAERLKTRKGKIVDLKKTERFDVVVLEFDE